MSSKVLWIGAVVALISLSGFAGVPPSAEAKGGHQVTAAFEWVREFGTSGDDWARAVSADDSGVYVAGTTSGALFTRRSAGWQDAFLMKYSASGRVLWARQFGTSDYDQANGVFADYDGNVYVAGNIQRPLPAGDPNVFVAKYDRNGNLRWFNEFGTTGVDYAWGVAAQYQGGVYIVGDTDGMFEFPNSEGSGTSFLAKFDANGNVLWTRQFPGGGPQTTLGVATYASVVYVITSDLNLAAGKWEVIIAKYDTNGNVLWTRQFGASGDTSGQAVAADWSGVYVAGYAYGVFTGQTSAGSGDAFLAKYSQLGDLQWIRQLGTSDFDGAYGATTDGSDIVYIAGATDGAFPGQTNAGWTDVFYAKYDMAGNAQWVRQVGTSMDDAAEGIAYDTSGTMGASSAYIAGITTGQFPRQKYSGGNDAFAARASIA